MMFNILWKWTFFKRYWWLTDDPGNAYSIESMILYTIYRFIINGYIILWAETVSYVIAHNYYTIEKSKILFLMFYIQNYMLNNEWFSEWLNLWNIIYKFIFIFYSVIIMYFFLAFMIQQRRCKSTFYSKEFSQCVSHQPAVFNHFFFR